MSDNIASSLSSARLNINVIFFVGMPLRLRACTAYKMRVDRRSKNFSPENSLSSNVSVVIECVNDVLEQFPVIVVTVKDSPLVYLILNS